MKKILIANRGEIACRVIRSARRLGYATVAVFSKADAQAPHVALADEAVCIGPPPAAASYLCVDALLDAARRTGADAVHPGYGFLSENAGFARACTGAGLLFIGPPAEAIEAMGDKAAAKQRMRAAGVPCIPGYPGGAGEAGRDDRLMAEAEAVGWPLLVKAVSGGGGRGMRLVHGPDELPQALASARREALSAFGDDRLMLERLVAQGRHIEIQVFCDAHGAGLHLGERDCSAQRRRQKVLEEAPSPIVGAALRERMGRDAVAAALAIGYRGAGTVEFIVDAGMQHYFLEMNTRLQVEHPVTEMITGLDLVEWQLRVAEGEPLPLRQEQVRFEGHAIELRLLAEDPFAGFAPQAGRIAWWRPERAALADGSVRVDDGIREGGEVTPHYDSMVAKLIAHGRNRSEAIAKACAALDAAPLLGLRNNARFLRHLLQHPRFLAGGWHTGLIDAWAAAPAPQDTEASLLLQAPAPDEAAWHMAAAVFALRGRAQPGAPLLRAASVAQYGLHLQAEGQQRCWQVHLAGGGTVRLQGPQAEACVRLLHCEGGRGPGHGELLVEMDGVQQRALALWVGNALHLCQAAATFVFEERSPWPDAPDKAGRPGDPSRVRAPVAGTVAQVLVQPGQAVQAGQLLLSIEAMKMETWLQAPGAGTVAAVHATPGRQVAAGALLAELHPHKN